MISGTPKRVIRIFISSAFEEFESERDILTNTVFKELRHLCEQNGFVFQPIDLRWGVTSADVAEGVIMKLCFDEIDRCKEYSPSVNFFIMAGENYGRPPLPSTIGEAVWSILIREYGEDDSRIELLKKCYWQDKNDRQAPYYLRLYANSDLSANDGVDTEQIRNALYELLVDIEEVSCGLANEQCEMSSRDALNALKWQMGASATEQEIMRGYFQEKYEPNIFNGKYNTFIILKESAHHNADECILGADPATRLRNRLRQEVPDRQSSQIYEKRSENDTGWLDATREFLKQAITAQIKRYDSLSQFDLEQQTLLVEYRFVDENYLEIPCASTIERFLDSNGGHCVLLTGESGSGKSWLLKHYAYRLNKKRVVAAVFNDVEPEGRSFALALEMIVRALRKAGKLDGEESSVNPDDPVGWFECELSRLNQDEDALVVLDSISAQNMPDYKVATGKSLFHMQLPESVTVVVSAAMPDDLRECDKKALEDTGLVFHLPAMGLQDIIQRLYSTLEKHGRRLYSWQQRVAVEECLRISPSLNTALDVDILMRICSKLHSWDTFPFVSAIDSHVLIRYALFRQNRDDYRLLRSHTLGFLALSTVGLTEPEIIALLSSDVDVVREIQYQTQKVNARWKFEGSIPTVLWAMQYAELKPFLTDIVVGGVAVLSLRHIRMRDAILAELGETERKKLLDIMRDYYNKKNWLVRSEEAIMPNYRKVQEYLPIYEKLGDTVGLSQILCQPECVDAYVRSGSIMDIKNFIEQYGTHTRSMRILSILYQKELLFKLWPESFVPVAFSKLSRGWDVYGDAWEDEWHELLGKRCYVQGEAGNSGWAFFPQLGERCRFALGPKGLVAALKDGKISILDLYRREILPTSCETIKEDGFLYWVDNCLIVRCARRRFRYSYHNGQLSFEGEDKDVESWDLLTENQDKVRRAGGWVEAEHFGVGLKTLQPLCGNVIRYHVDDCTHLEEVFEPYANTLRVKVCGTLAALVIDDKRLIVVELTERVKLHEELVYGLTDIEWFDTDCTLLIVARGNSLRILSIDQNKPIGYMLGPQSSYLHYRAWVGSMRFVKDFNTAIRELAYLNHDAYTSKEGASFDVPLFGALSMERGWAACYFYTKFGAYISVRDTNAKQTIRIDNVNEITYQDCVNDPFYAAPGQDGLILYSHGAAYLYDLQSRTMKKVSASQVERPPLDEVAASIRFAYTSFMVDAMHLQTDAGLCVNRRRRGGIFQRGKVRREEQELIRSVLPYRRLLHADVLSFESGYWLVDKDNGFYHAFDRAGKCLYRGMSTSRILAADIDRRDNSLHLLMDTGRINSISLVTPK